MTDRFVDRVADLAGRTTRALNSVADKLDAADAGLEADAQLLRGIATQQAKVALDCMVETQPIELERRAPAKHLRDLAEEARQLAATLMSRSLPGHDGASEAAEYLEQTASLVDRALEP
jgi:hypothetical protein